ncbi:hypothetical protein ACFX2C_018020 [Malus domestica]
MKKSVGLEGPRKDTNTNVTNNMGYLIDSRLWKVKSYDQMTGVEQIANQSHSKGINLVDCRGELELNQSVSVLHSPQLSSPVA